ncbi:MAG: uracil-DNA glycosylase [Flavobacteriaceae bacterium]|nr:uracil-DNA glycosylase [Flavobacteriaceae bacterium]MEE2723510.1 uracil-DNA glycosylase [Bacteroidota bacterium]|tara:strand:+ start:6244 stop:6915 length:672 start_codon:yes stop_codon:yes gene_type:complete
MAVSIHPEWENILQDTFESVYFKALIHFVKSAYGSAKCFPPGKLIFNAFDLCPPEKTKVVILGQDPYHGPGQAHGLCFSVPRGVPHPPSLINIFKELEKDVKTPYPKSGNLSPWAKQGVLLLNTTLTVQANRAGSHQGKGWEKFTDQVIHILSNNYKNIVFLLWGSYAKQKIKIIDREKHFVLTSGHPSPLSANRGYWFGNSHFSKTNDYLTSKGKKPINWNL